MINFHAHVETDAPARGVPATWQAVQITANNPSRTAVDFNGDIWVANRAFGGQSSVTKIANDLTECADRNGTPGLQTSSDVNGEASRHTSSWSG